MRYGFVGLGELGGHLAASLVKAGFSVTVHDRDPAKMARLVDLGAQSAPSAAEAAASADAVITCLPSPTISRAVLTGESGILAGLCNGGTWIEMSTLGTEEI